MKKHFLFVRLACLVSLLVAQVVMAQDCPFTPDMFPGQAADRTSYEASATVAVGGSGVYNTHVHSQVTGLTSTNEMVVSTFNQNGYDAVFFVGVGSADVTYTEDWFTGGGDGAEGSTSFCSTSHTIHYTVVEGTPEAYFSLENQPVTEYHAVQGGAFNPPSAVIIVKEKRMVAGFPQMQDMYISAMQMTFTSSNESVATIGRGNTVTPAGGVGQTTITATWGGSAIWNGVTISYTLYVEEPKKTAYISFSPTMDYTEEIGSTLLVQPTIYPDGAPIAIDRWVSTNPAVASVTQTGMVSMLAPGTTRIQAVFDGNDTYYPATGYYNLTVVKRNPGMYFDATEVYAEPGVPFTPPTFHNPNNVPINKWNSQNMSVAEVSDDGSVVTIKGLGDAYIFCESYETDEYAAQSVGYTIHVDNTGLTVAGRTVTMLNAEDIMGDGTAWYDRTTRTLTLHGFQRSSTIATMINYEKHDAPLYIVVEGQLTIAGVGTCIAAPYAAVVMMGGEDGGKATLSATQVAISAPYFKIHQCSLTATGTAAALALGQELGISRGSYLMAHSDGLAIQCHSFIMTDEVVEGYAIDILTEGVRFVKNTGFYDATNQYAKTVEIGKVPVVVPDDEVTTIDFIQTDPESSDVVVFSANAENTFNEETGQLEISTSLTDAQVSEALENLIPGSSAWVSALPGSLVFDVPAGAGKLKVHFITLPGYALQVKMEGEDVVTITSAELGWVTIDYNVSTPVHVVIYLHAENPSNAPARIAANMQDGEPAAGAYIQQVVIAPANAPEDHTAIDTVNANDGENSKILFNGRMFILRGDKVYTVTGQEVR